MPLVRVNQRRISIRESSKRNNTPHFLGEELQMSEADFKRLSPSGAVVLAEDWTEPETEAEAEALTPELNPVEEGQVAALLGKLSHKELDARAEKAGVSWDGKPSKAEKAQRLVEAGVVE